jgi:streptomycin 6-kinase
VPALAARLARQWDFAIASEEFRNGYNAVVLPTVQRGRPLVLKLAWPPGQVRGEADALAEWRGRGAVELLARELADSLPARQRALGHPVPDQWIMLAAALAADLARDPGRWLVHTDLHYGNILASERPGQPWVAIDPAAAAGTPERSTAELLWTRADELPGPGAITELLGTLVENGQLDRAKAVAWSFVRSIDYWLWGLENGLTTDPLRCQRIASALAPMAEQCNLSHRRR